ncbi:BspA family leucine-rich repeat surface protein, partial [Campylobacter lari]
MYKVKNKNELMKLVQNERISLRDIDVSLIEDFSFVFYCSTRKDFLGIERWDVSKAKDMSYMFYCCESFNADLSRWDVS